MNESSGDPPPPNYKDRKVGLVIFGSATVLAGLFAALFALLIALSGTMAAARGNPPSPAPPIHIWPIAIMYLLIAAGFVWLGIGSILARRWARALLAVSSWSFFFIGLLTLVGYALMAPRMSAFMGATRTPGRLPLSETQVFVVMVIMLATTAFFTVVLPLIWGLFYSGKNVKATCEARDPVIRWTDRCPLPVLVVVLWTGLGALLFLIMAAYFPILVLFGVVLTGWPVKIIALLLAFLWAYLTWALYRLDRRGWWIFFACTILCCISGVITFARRNPGEIFARMGYSPAQATPFQALTGNHLMLWSQFLFSIPFLCYLLYIRKFFPREGNIVAPNDQRIG